MSPKPGLPLQCMLKTTTAVVNRRQEDSFGYSRYACTVSDSQGMPAEELLPQETKVFEWCKDVQFWYLVDINMRVHI